MGGLACQVDGYPAELAPAKVNLNLHITGRRADGYHLLDSLFAFTDFGDRIILLGPGTGGPSLEVTGPFSAGLDGLSGDNLVLRAARTASAAAGRPEVLDGLRLRLDKQLPIAAGIGGGSSDAAAVMRLLNREFALGLTPDQLAGLALSLGADVPACVASRLSHVTGVGEVVHPLDLPLRGSVLLVNPGIPVGTADVFARYRDIGQFSRPTDARLLASDLSPALLSRLTTNDLQEPALLAAPVIGDVLARLQAFEPSDFLVRMSGSGGTCFLWSEGPAEALLEFGRTLPEGWWHQVCRWLG